MSAAGELSRHGCRVALVARDANEVARAAASVNVGGNGRAITVPADVRDYGAIATAVAQIEADLGPITALVNNAGTAGPAGFDWEVDPDEWWECIESIVRGAFNCTRAVVPGMIEPGPRACHRHRRHHGNEGTDPGVLDTDALRLRLATCRT
jgi:NAD(P)-dependent dehydrogenase (short-subunit alcohol dehydrogenase family)